jgi:hypothetical protein
VANPPTNGGGLATKEGLSVSFHSGHRNQRHEWNIRLSLVLKLALVTIRGAAILNLGTGMFDSYC